jgi:predicted  nucleic acid-binding Zn-ribbon protein
MEQSRVGLETVLAGLQQEVAAKQAEHARLDGDLEHVRDLHRQLDAELESKQLVLSELDTALKLMQSAVEEEERKALMRKISIDEHGDDPLVSDTGFESDIDHQTDEEYPLDLDAARRQRIEHGAVPTEIEDEEVVLEL